MKNFKLAMICLALAATVMAVTDAEAGRKKKPAKGARTEKPEEMKKPRRFDNYPTMEFRGGILTRDAHTGWKIGDMPLHLNSECVITMDGSEVGMLVEGREAVIMGARMGEAISAYSIHVSQPEYKNIGKSMSDEPKERGPNPNVGKILKRAE
ncbi:MAG: hypothetical protein ABFS42_09720 [Candidatus Krumholzibacteriota bacterium]